MEQHHPNNTEYISLVQKTAELTIRVSNIETTMQNQALHTNRSLTDLRDELIRTSTEIKTIVSSLGSTVSSNRESLDSKISKAIEENNRLLDAKFASGNQVTILSTKIDKLSTKISIMGGSVVLLGAILAWLVEHPQFFSIFK